MIRHLIIDRIVENLQETMIDNLPEDDAARAGIITKGPLQGDPDPDQARISISVHEGDPDSVYAGSFTSMKDAWVDEIVEIEAGSGAYAAIWARRFSIKARCLLVNTGEGLDAAREIAATVEKRIIRALLRIDWSGVADEDEYVSRPVLSTGIKAEALQGGGPPDSYDYYIKVRFDVQTCMGE